MFGFPVRVHPAFFILPLILGAGLLQNAENSPGITLIVLATVFFVSILVHELGHAFAFRYYGIHSRIVLYWMGGLAIPDAGSAWTRPTASLNPNQQIVVSLAGPIFGFLLAALLIGIVFALDGTVVFYVEGILPSLYPILPANFATGPATNAAKIFLQVGIWANVFLNVLNLAPVYPLDGGQVARQLFVLNGGLNEGIRNSMMLSIAAGGLIALASFMGEGGRFIGFFFGFMAWSNYMTLQQMGGFGGGRPW